MRVLLGASLVAMGVLLAASSAPAASIRIGNGTGPLVTTSGPATNPNAAVNLGGANLGGTNLGGGTTPTALATTNLPNGGGNGPTATVQLGVPTGGTNGNTVSATIGAPGSAGLGSTPTGDATVDLLGNDGTNGVATLGGAGTDNTIALGTDGGIGNGNAGDGLGSGGAGLELINGAGGSQMATTGVGAAGNCNGPSEAQIARFLALHAHGNIGSWSRASNVQVIPVKACPAARARLSAVLGANGNVRSTQLAAAADALISASLSRSHHSASKVIAVDQAGPTLTVYVY